MAKEKRRFDWDRASTDDRKLWVTLLRNDGHSDKVIGVFFGKSKGAIVGFRHRELPELSFGPKATKPRVELARFEELLAGAQKGSAPETIPTVPEAYVPPVAPGPPPAPVSEPVQNRSMDAGCEWPLSGGGSLKKPKLCGKLVVRGHKLCQDHLAELPGRRK